MSILASLLIVTSLGAILMARRNAVLARSNEQLREGNRGLIAQRDRFRVECGEKNQAILGLAAENRVLHAIVRGQGKHAPPPMSLVTVVPDNIASLDDWRNSDGAS